MHPLLALEDPAAGAAQPRILGLRHPTASAWLMALALLGAGIAGDWLAPQVGLLASRGLVVGALLGAAAFALGRALRMSQVTIVSWLAIALLIVLIRESVDWDFTSSLAFSDLWTYREALLRGLGVTLAASGTAIVLGLALGTVLAILLQVPVAAIRVAVMAYVEVARNLPLVVQLFWIHFALPELTGISTTAVQSGFIAIAFQASGYLTDIARAGIQAVPRGQFEAAHALGLPRPTKWLVIILPQALRIVIPPLANVSISFFKASSILSVISVGELMSMGLRVSEASFRPIETITFCGLVYIVLGTLFSRATQQLERLTAERTRRPPPADPAPSPPTMEAR